MIVTGRETRSQRAVCRDCSWNVHDATGERSRELLNAADEHVEETHHVVELRVESAARLSWKAAA